MSDSDHLPGVWRRIPAEWRLRLAASELLGYLHPWAHSTTTKFPRAFGPITEDHPDPAVRGLIDPDHRFIDCSSMSTFCIMSTFPDITWTDEDYGDMQVFTDRLPERPWSPIEAVVRRGVGRESEQPWEETWRGRARLCFYVQGWRRDPAVNPSGHQLLMLVNRSGAVSRLESVNVGGDGPQWVSTAWGWLDHTFPWAWRAARLRAK